MLQVRISVVRRGKGGIYRERKERANCLGRRLLCDQRGYVTADLPHIIDPHLHLTLLSLPSLLLLLLPTTILFSFSPPSSFFLPHPYFLSPCFSLAFFPAWHAAMEALAYFRGTDHGSVEVKKRDLKSELKREAEKVHKGEEGQPRSRKTRWGVHYTVMLDLLLRDILVHMYPL